MKLKIFSRCHFAANPHSVKAAIETIERYEYVSIVEVLSFELQILKQIILIFFRFSILIKNVKNVTHVFEFWL